MEKPNFAERFDAEDTDEVADALNEKVKRSGRKKFVPIEEVPSGSPSVEDQIEQRETELEGIDAAARFLTTSEDKEISHNSDIEGDDIENLNIVTSGNSDKNNFFNERTKMDRLRHVSGSHKTSQEVKARHISRKRRASKKISPKK